MKKKFFAVAAVVSIMCAGYLSLTKITKVTDTSGLSLAYQKVARIEDSRYPQGVSDGIHGFRILLRGNQGIRTAGRNLEVQLPGVDCRGIWGQQLVTTGLTLHLLVDGRNIEDGILTIRSGTESLWGWQFYPQAKLLSGSGDRITKEEELDFNAIIINGKKMHNGMFKNTDRIEFEIWYLLQGSWGKAIKTVPFRVTVFPSGEVNCEKTSGPFEE